MRWSMDTHKYMSEITRTALQIIAKHGIDSNSDPKEIEDTEKELAQAKVYKDFSSASGRIRRALFTYFKAYFCLDEQEKLTPIGQAFVDNKLSVQEISFYYVANYRFTEGEHSYFPLHLILCYLQKVQQYDDKQAFITPYDFSVLVDCNSIEDITDELLLKCIEARGASHPEINERAIGFDVWAKMLVQAGILQKKSDHSLYIENKELCDWILSSFTKTWQNSPGNLDSGILQNIPGIQCKINGNPASFSGEGNAVQAFLFEGITPSVINKYIINNRAQNTLDDLLIWIGLDNTSRGHYHTFVGLERLVGHRLLRSKNPNEVILGKVILSAEFFPEDFDNKISDGSTAENMQTSRIGENILLYGVPGSGKSWTVAHEYCSNENVMERVVFHPDYTYADFVGQIMPVMKMHGDKIAYKFVPGPFTKILKKAWDDTQSHFFLIIEEINRGNAPAIFGDIFQLLDREKDGISSGQSVYGITNSDIARTVFLDNVDEASDQEIKDAEEKLIHLPRNLTIIATMNTSDQNVFTLDTAFQRRWHMRMIDNDLDGNAEILDSYICDTSVTWRKFLETVNQSIISENSALSSNEDKRLGIYFVEKAELKTVDVWAEKVIKYLWDDAFKFNRDRFFNLGSSNGLDSILKSFKTSTRDLRFNIFTQEVVDKLVVKENQPQGNK